MISLGFPLYASEGLPDISEDDLYKHICVIGGTGKGKTTFLLNLINQIQGRKIILDPNGALAKKALGICSAEYISKDTPISLNPLTRDYLSNSEIANELAEVLNTATKVTNQEQTDTTVLMARLIRNVVRVGIKDLRELSNFFDYEEERRKINDKFWRNFDAVDKKGWYINREMRESAKRISAFGKIDLCKICGKIIVPIVMFFSNLFHAQVSKLGHFFDHFKLMCYDYRRRLLTVDKCMVTMKN